MEKIKRIWIAGSRIFMADENSMEYSRPLQAFPRLLLATERQREDYKISRWEDSVRWETIDEDIHISSFQETTEPDYGNAVYSLLKEASPAEMLSLSQRLGIDQSLLYRYFYGMLQPSVETIAEIKAAAKDLTKTSFRRIAAVF